MVSGGTAIMVPEAEREAVRVAALKLLMRVCAERADDPLPLPERQRTTLRSMVLAGNGERAICSALGLPLDTVRAMLVRLAR